ncbi:protein kinase [Streptomyces sp. NBC_01351]|uniref:serine/threonine-protein kinase n=1 Tax=Streptomyces sp. NBC_01351 TaxID=2903833 RepID=UPI002E363612|nr:protein kinase [Streptomyces sp. NBC_01351]
MADVSGALVGGRYQLLELVGQGGMGRVWRGRDETLGREVAVKEVTLPQGVGDAQREVLLRRVMREAKAAARLNHPGIITVHDVVVHEGAPVIVMEYVTGTSLAAAVAQGGHLPVRRVAEIGVQLLKALGRAHAAGIVHRDLKPDNVLLMDERVIITDFGIAHMADATTALTHTGAIIGTPSYMAPEQLEGEPPTPATDLWALGATLYGAVEGVQPFSAETFTALCIAIVTQEPRPAERAGPLTDVLAALLTKDPARRATADQALAALEPVASGAVPAPRVPRRAVPPPTRGPAAARAARQAPVAARRARAASTAAAPDLAPGPSTRARRAMLLRGGVCFALVWLGAFLLPWFRVEHWIRPTTAPTVLAVALILALVNAVLRPRLPAVVEWILFVCVNMGLFIVVDLLRQMVHFTFVLNGLLLGTCCFMLWRAVPGRR